MAIGRPTILAARLTFLESRVRGNSQFIPDFAYKYVRPCGLQYCYFNLLEDSGVDREQFPFQRLR